MTAFGMSLPDGPQLCKQVTLVNVSLSKTSRGPEGAAAGQAGSGRRLRKPAERISEEERRAALARTFGCLSGEEPTS